MGNPQKGYHDRSSTFGQISKKDELGRARLSDANLVDTLVLSSDAAPGCSLSSEETRSHYISIRLKIGDTKEQDGRKQTPHNLTQKRFQKKY